MTVRIITADVFAGLPAYVEIARKRIADDAGMFGVVTT